MNKISQNISKDLKSELNLRQDFESWLLGERDGPLGATIVDYGVLPLCRSVCMATQDEEHSVDVPGAQDYKFTVAMLSPFNYYSQTLWKDGRSFCAIELSDHELTWSHVGVRHFYVTDFPSISVNSCFCYRYCHRLVGVNSLTLEIAI